jgi:hypothetical protein
MILLVGVCLFVVAVVVVVVRALDSSRSCRHFSLACAIHSFHVLGIPWTVRTNDFLERRISLPDMVMVMVVVVVVVVQFWLFESRLVGFLCSVVVLY